MLLNENISLAAKFCIAMAAIALALHSSEALADEIYRISNLQNSVNGEWVPAKAFVFDVEINNAGHDEDELSLVFDQSGFVELRTKIFETNHLFAAGEVEKFVKILRRSAKSAKDARFTKEAGDFRIGGIGGELFLVLTTGPGGDFEHFTLFSKASEGSLVDHIVTQEQINVLASLLTQKDQIVGELSGEGENVKIVKIAMSEPGSGAAKGGQTLRIVKEKATRVFSVEDVGFRIVLAEKNMKQLRGDLNRALQYLTSANRTYDDKPDKKFNIVGLGASPVTASIEGYEGNGDRYYFVANVSGDGDEKPRYFSLSEEQLAKLVGILSH